MDKNKQSIEMYEKYADEYLARKDDDAKNGLDEARKNALKECLIGLPKSAKIFEVGAAAGDDAKFFQSLGYENIVVSDIAESFLAKLKQNGFSPIKFDLAKDEFDDKYDFIYCWAVLVHLTKDDARAALKKIYDALNDGGRMVVNVKTPDGDLDEEFSRFADDENKRIYFSYWAREEFESCLGELGFRKVKIWGYGRWLDCCAEK